MYAGLVSASDAHPLYGVRSNDQLFDVLHLCWSACEYEVGHGAMYARIQTQSSKWLCACELPILITTSIMLDGITSHATKNAPLRASVDDAYHSLICTPSIEHHSNGIGEYLLRFTVCKIVK